MKYEYSYYSKLDKATNIREMNGGTLTTIKQRSVTTNFLFQFAKYFPPKAVKACSAVSWKLIVVLLQMVQTLSASPMNIQRERGLGEAVIRHFSPLYSSATLYFLSLPIFLFEQLCIFRDRIK